MHWAVQSKKDQMLEAPDLHNSNNVTNEIWTQHTENNEDRLSDGNREQDVAISDVKPQSSKNPDSPSKWNQQLQKIAVSRHWPEAEAFSHAKFFSRIICLTGSFLNVVWGWGFVWGFMLFIILLLISFWSFRTFLPPYPMFARVFVSKNKNWRRRKKQFL